MYHVLRCKGVRPSDQTTIRLPDYIMDFRRLQDSEQFEVLLGQYLFFPERTFAAEPREFGLPYENIWLTTADEVRIHGWLIPNIDAPATLLFLHGNGGNISHRLDNLKRLFDAGLQIFILDYRGYGRSEGRPTEAGTYRDAEAAWTWLAEEIGGPIVIFGRSLGGAVATWLATQPDVTPAGLVLENTFTRGRDIAQTVLPAPGMARMLPDFYPTIDRVGDLAVPLLIVHGERDELIPVEHGHRLYEAATEPKSLYLVPDGRHNDTYVVGGDQYLARITDFVQQYVE